MYLGKLRNDPVFYLFAVLFWLFEVNWFFCLRCLNLKNPFMYYNTDLSELNEPNNWRLTWVSKFFMKFA